MPELLAPAARFTSRYGALVVLGWVVPAAIGNLAVPQLERVVASHARSFMPTDAPSAVAAKRSAELFGDAASNNLNYIVLERDRPLERADRRYYDRLIAALRADTTHVYSVTDLWANPTTGSAAQSRDGQAADVMLRLPGMLGTSQASKAVAVVRDTAVRLGPPPGLHVYVTGPGSTLTDEFAAIDHQMLLITAATVLVITVLLLVVYRSAVTAAIPLISVGLALAVARPLVAALGNHGLVEVSLFSVALVAAMILGAGTDDAIFLIGRYHEGRRRGTDRATALVDAYRGVAPVVVGSALTMATALACLSLAQVGMFRSTGIPCAIGVLVGMSAALTLTPALIGLASRRGMVEPRRSAIGRRWRRIGVIVARWPGPVLVASGGLIAILILPLIGMRTGWNEPAATPMGTESNRGYAAMDRHFSANRLLPDIVTVQADHDLRNPAGLIAVERITRQIMAIPGVRMVQWASRPAGSVPGRGMQGSANGLREIGSGADDMRTGINGMRDTVDVMSGYLTPLRNYVDTTPDCAANAICSLVSRVVEPVDSVVRSTGAGFRGSAAGGFYLPSRALSDPRYRQALNDLVSRDGRSTYLVVYGDGQEWGVDGAQRARQIEAAVAEATKEGSLTPVSVGLAGVGPASRDLQGLVHGDIVLLVAATLALIFLIVAVMLLRSPVAAVVVVGADYNLLLAMRIREELRAGIGTGVVRAFAGTGGVVTTAGIVFGITMFALAGSTVLSIEQVGLTVGIGLLLDTLIVRTFLMPSLVALLGRWFWWPRLPDRPRARPIVATSANWATRRVGSDLSA